MSILENLKLHYMKRLTTLFLALTMATTLLAQGRKGVPQIPVYPELQEQGSFSSVPLVLVGMLTTGSVLVERTSSPLASSMEKSYSWVRRWTPALSGQEKPATMPKGSKHPQDSQSNPRVMAESIQSGQG